MRRLAFLTLIVLLVGAVGAAAQDDGGAWTLSEVIDLAEAFEDYRGGGAVLSPDGTMFAWAEQHRAICVYVIDDDALTCTPWPEDLASIHYFTWSSDGAYLAMTENFYLFLNEPDLWLFDVAAGTFTNYSDDGVTNVMEADESFWIDLFPTWDPISGDLFFFRSEKIEEGYTLELYRLTPGEDAPELVRDLTDDLSSGFPVYKPPAISPDGAQMAMPIAGRERDDVRNGVWVLDLSDDTLVQVASQDDFRVGLPEWQEDVMLIPDGLAWAGNGGLVIYALDYSYAASYPAQNCYYVDVTSGEITPLVDFSSVPDGPSFYDVGEDGHTGLYRIPRLGIVAPDGSAFFYLHYDLELADAAISALPLPPDGSAPVLLGDIDYELTSITPTPIVTASSNGRVLLHNRYLLTFEQ